MVKSIIYYSLITLQLSFWDGLIFALADEKKCALNDATSSQCALNEMCIESVCRCMLGFERLKGEKGDIGECVKNASDKITPSGPSASSINPPERNHSGIAFAVVIPIMLLLFTIGLVVIVRKYNIVTWVRNKINQRQTPYDEVMIGQDQDDDDPPLVGV